MAVLVSSALASYGLGFVVHRLLRAHGIIDQPNERTSHTVPTVRGGGLAIMAVVFSATLLASGGRSPNINTLAVTAGAIAVISFLDDLKSLGSVTRFFCHSLAALVVLWRMGWPEITLTLTPTTTLFLPPVLGVSLGFLWLVGYTNAFNFMDGINGLAAGQALITALGSALLVGLLTDAWASEPVIVAGAIAGASAGFLPHNFPKARMFMGDVSSAPLGFSLAVLVLWISREKGWTWLVPLGLLHMNFVLDTGITLAKRIARGERWYEPHREHFYQRLVQSGRTHSFVTCWELGLQFINLGMVALYLRGGFGVRIGVVVFTVALWLVFFRVCELRWRRSENSHPTKSWLPPDKPLSERQA